MNENNFIATKKYIVYILIARRSSYYLQTSLTAEGHGECVKCT